LTAPDPAHPDTLGTNKSLLVGQSLTSADGTTVLSMQADGNLVLTCNGQTVWTSGTGGKPAHDASMKWDGNLHVRDANTNDLWSNGATGHKDAFLRVNNGGAMFVWDGSNHEIWDSGTTGGKVNPVPGGSGSSHTDFGGVDQFLKEAANTCGDALKVIAPIAAIVVNIIPGIGQAASAAICAGIAAATASVAAAQAVLNKNPAALAAVASSVAAGIPGGSDPSVQAAITIGTEGVTQAATGNVDPSALLSAAATIPGVPPQTQSALSNVGQILASGSPVTSQQVAAALNQLPTNVQAGVHIGCITGNSAVIGASTTPNTSTLTAFEHLGLQREATDPVALQGRTLAGTGTHGFDIGIGCTLNKISASNLGAVRTQLSPVDQKGFDMALALHIGNMVAPPPPPGTGASASAAYAITHGMGSHTSDAKASIMSNLANSPNARPGAVLAVKAIASKNDDGWFHRLLHWLGLVK
jgi:hypothetical protein